MSARVLNGFCINSFNSFKVGIIIVGIYLHITKKKKETNVEKLNNLAEVMPLPPNRVWIGNQVGAPTLFYHFGT